MSMPASEFVEWQAYFNLYPFSMDRFEYMASKLCAIIYNTAGKMFRSSLPMDTFLPDFMKESKETKPFVMKSKEEQDKDWKMFIHKARAVGKQAGRNIVKERKAL